MSNELFDVSKMTSEEMEILSTQLLQTRMGRLETSLKEMRAENQQLKSQVEIYQTDIGIKLDQTKEEAQKQIEIEVSGMRVDRSKWGFVAQRDIGGAFRVSMSSITIGKLLRVVGLALKKRSGNTEPYRQFIGKYATTEIVNGYSTYRWHQTECIKYIDNWLKDNDYYEDFYTISNENNLKKMIDELYDLYVK